MIIKESAKHTIEFGEICIHPLDGESIDHGFGVNLFNYGKGHDHSWEFNYCPWCGKKIMETAEAITPESDAARERRVDLCTACQNTEKIETFTAHENNGQTS